MNELIKSGKAINKILITNRGNGRFFPHRHCDNKGKYPAILYIILISDKALGIVKRLDFIDRIIVLYPRSLWRYFPGIRIFS